MIHARMRNLGVPAAITLTHGLAMGTTFLLFAIVARQSDIEDVGRYAMAIALSTTVQQIADWGVTPLMIREISRGADQRASLRWVVRRRAFRLAALSPLLAALLLAAGIPIGATLSCIAITALTSAYAVAIAHFQARVRFGYVVGLQLTNALGFGVAGVVFSLSFEVLDITTALFMAMIAITPAGVWGSIYIAISTRAVFPTFPDTVDRRNFPMILIANLTTTAAALLVLGVLAPAVAAEYAKVQQPAQIFAPISIALTSMLLPRFSRMSRAEIEASLKKIIFYLPLFPMGGAAIGFSSTPLLELLYIESRISYLNVTLLFGAYATGIYVAILSVGLIAVGRSNAARTVAVVQCAVTICAVAISVASESATTVIIGDCIARTLAAAIMIWSVLAWMRGSDVRNN